MRSREKRSPVERLEAAVMRGNFRLAERILDDIPEPWSDACRTQAARIHLARERWEEALHCLEGLETSDPSTDLSLHLARNLLALKEHRPQLYEKVRKLPRDDRYQIDLGPRGRPCIFSRTGTGQQVAFSDPSLPEGDRDWVSDLQDAYSPVALLGLGDGLLLEHLVTPVAEHAFDLERPVYVVEPSEGLLVLVLMLRDFSQPDGPLARERFHLFVGPEALDELIETLEANPQLPTPIDLVNQGEDTSLRSRLNVYLRSRTDRELARIETVREHYRDLDPEELTAVLGPRPPRKPRALLLTSRFTTVLQFATREVADALEELGWEVEIAIESAPYRRTTVTFMLDLIEEHWPDLVFQIDHLRYEHHPYFPPELPFVCWIQDYLPNLARVEAGRSVGPRDFVLTSDAYYYRTRFEYPARQCLAMSKAASAPGPGLVTPGEGGHDLVFLSSASETPARLVRKLLTQDVCLRHRALVEEACDRISQLYARGESLPLVWHVAEVLREILREGRHVVASPEDFDDLSHFIFSWYNDRLYRQQALEWIVEEAGRRDLDLALYGVGWERQERFAPHARGYLEPGDELRQIVRSSAINFQLAPYSCFHQRVLEGLLDGGFFLVRSHPKNHDDRELGEFLLSRDRPEFKGLEDLLASLDEGERARLGSLLERSQIRYHNRDLLLLWRVRRESGGRHYLPAVRQISFDGPAELAERLDRFLDGEADRRSLVELQASYVREHLSYRGQLERIIAQIRDRLLAEEEDGVVIEKPLKEVTS